MDKSNTSDQLNLSLSTPSGPPKLEISSNDILKPPKDEINQKKIHNDLQSLNPASLKLNNDQTLLDENNTKETFQVYFRFWNKFFSLDLNPNNTIDEVKDVIRHTQSIDMCQYRLIYKGKQLEEYRTLSEYDMKEGCMIFLAHRFKGEGA
jgi:hypothetical protein